MHGAIFFNFKKFITQRFDDETWEKTIEQAGLADRLYVPINIYADADMAPLLEAASSTCHMSRTQLLEAFGEFVAKPLMEMYPALVPAEWGTVDLLLNVEDKIHSVVRMKIPDAHPAGIHVQQLEDGLLEVIYQSPRNLPELAVGAIRGVAKHFGDEAEFLDHRELDVGKHRYLVRIRPRAAAAS